MQSPLSIFQASPVFHRSRRRLTPSAGYSIRSYDEDEAIPLYVNKVYSDNTQLQYAYYDLPFVCPASGKKHAGLASGRGKSLNLGEVLRGDRIMTSDYDLVMDQDQECTFLCSQTVDRAAVKRAKKMIEDGYVAEWIVDNLPGATSFVTVDRSQKYYAAGFKIGSKEYSSVSGQPRYVIYNHLTLVVKWRKAPGKVGEQGGKVIVGFEVYPKSVSSGDREASGCPIDVRHRKDDPFELYIRPNNSLIAQKYPSASYLPEEDEIDDGASLTIPYSYSVYFREDARVEWSNRWDMYFKNQDESSRIHWLAIVNSLVIAGLMTAVVTMVWNRTMHGDTKTRDGPLEEGKGKMRRKIHSGARTPRLGEKSPSGLLDKFEEDGLSSDDESIEDITGWKLLHADVFRTPSYAGLLAPMIGSGCQLVFMATGLLVLSCLGVLNPSFRGGFISVGMGLFVFAGIFSGYFSGRVYKTFGGVNWRKNTLMVSANGWKEIHIASADISQTALLVPGMIFSTIFVLNLFVWAQGSSTALPFGTVVGLAALWLLIQLPLVYGGSWFGYYRCKPWDHPTKTSSIPRQIPGSAWYTKGWTSILIAGLVPFAVIFIELLFVFRSLWQDKSGYYYVYGFLSVVSLVHILTVIEVTVVAVYIMLCSEVSHLVTYPISLLFSSLRPSTDCTA